MKNRHIYKCDNCPQCGRREGASMGSSRWEHNFLCCSDECGIAYANNPDRLEKEVKRLNEQIDTLVKMRDSFVGRLKK